MVEELWTIFLRTVFIYLFVLLIMRLMGKREIGKLSLFDLIVSFMMANMSTMAIETETKLINVIIPILTLVALQMILSYLSLKYKKVRVLVDGEPTVLIKNGQIQDASMAKARYNLDDLLMQLRDKNILDVADVEFAILETSGKLSVFAKEKNQPLTKSDLPYELPLKPFDMPVPVIMDGKVQDDALHQLEQNRFWLKNQIQKQGYKDFKEIFYASVNKDGRLYIDRKDPLNPKKKH